MKNVKKTLNVYLRKREKNYYNQWPALAGHFFVYSFSLYRNLINTLPATRLIREPLWRNGFAPTSQDSPVGLPDPTQSQLEKYPPQSIR